MCGHQNGPHGLPYWVSSCMCHPSSFLSQRWIPAPHHPLSPGMLMISKYHTLIQESMMHSSSTLNISTIETPSSLLLLPEVKFMITLVLTLIIHLMAVSAFRWSNMLTRPSNSCLISHNLCQCSWWWWLEQARPCVLKYLYGNRMSQIHREPLTTQEKTHWVYLNNIHLLLSIQLVHPSHNKHLSLFLLSCCCHVSTSYSLRYCSLPLRTSTSILLPMQWLLWCLSHCHRDCCLCPYYHVSPSLITQRKQSIPAAKITATKHKNNRPK